MLRCTGNLQAQGEARGVGTGGGPPTPSEQDAERQSPPVISSKASNTLSCSGWRGAVLEAGSLEGGLGEESARPGSGWA